MAIGTNSDQALNLILRQFTISEHEYTFSPMTSGLINDTFLVSKLGHPLFVLQRINHLVFENVSGLMDNMERALGYLKGASYAELKLIKTKNGNSFYTTKKEPIGYWRLMRFLEHTRTYDNAPNEIVAFEAGRIIGKFHALLQKSKSSDYVDTIPRFHDVSLRELQFNNALKTADSNKVAIAKEAISFATKTIGRLHTLKVNNLPMRVCHNDTKLNNILFSEKTNQALCLIDLDTIMAGHFHYDFGDAVRTIVNTAAEDEQNHEKITFKKHFFKAFVKGLASNEPFLSEKEITSLPTGVILMPFLHGLRALTDFLENNKYYKVSYENQNLDRARSLFNFTEKAFTNVNFMNTTTRAIFNSLPA